jgi:Protein of unknown function (DUF3082)
MTEETAPANLKEPTPLRCLSGSAIAGAMTYMLYLLTSKIATSFAHTPLNGTSQAAANISVAVRTLVTGMTALGTGVFGIVSLGLILLAAKVAFTKKQPGTSA